MTTTVYVSATQADLAECREAIRVAARRLRIDDIAMEAYVAGAQQPLERCLEDVARCDYYIGLFAWRYGFVPPGESYSITELEYRKAVQLGKPCLIFMLADSAPWPAIHIDHGADGDRMLALRKELTNTHLCSFFRTPDDLSALATAALANLISHVSDSSTPLVQQSPGLAPNRTVPAEATWQAYYARLQTCYGGVALDAFTPVPGTNTARIELTSVFLEPNAREDARPETPRPREHPLSVNLSPPTTLSDGTNVADLAQLRASYQAEPSSRLFDLLTDDEHRTTVLLGDPGAGKSAVARYLALSLTETPVRPRLQPLEGFVPFLIELRSYAGLLAERRCDDFIDYLDFRHRSDGVGIPKPELRAYLEAGGAALVILDGLDEIFDRRQREEVANQITAFAARYPAVRVLVTARIVGYSRRILGDAGFEHFTLEDLNESQRGDFLRRWYDRVMPHEEDQAKILRRRMQWAIRDSPAIRELAGNPLLLSILAVIGRHQELPKERWRLYDHAASVLIEHWDANRNLRELHGGPDFLDTNDKKKLLRRLAYRMQSENPGANAHYIGQDDLSRLFEDYFVERYNHPRATAHMLANTMIEQFHQRNFILGQYGQNVYGFVHRTFLEFFYAQAVVRKFTEQDPEWSVERLKKLFAAHWDDPSWREVLRLLAGALDASVAAELIGVLANEVNRPWPPEKFPEPPWNLALAVQCLAELQNPSQAPQIAEALLRQLILLIEHGVSIADRDTAELVEAEILPAIRVIGTNWPGRAVYLDWFRRRGINVSWTTGSSFATHVAVLLSTPTEGIEDLLEKVLGADSDRRARLSLIAGLAESAALPIRGVVPATKARRAKCRALLERHAATDNLGAVRLAALHALVDQFPMDVPLTALLQERARIDTYSEVRLMAVVTLDWRRTTDDVTRASLIEIARNDLDGQVRRAAIEALSKTMQNDEEVTSLLVERVRNDTSVEAFQAAVRALGDQPASKPRLRVLLENRIRSDAGDPVRRAATRLLAEFGTRESLLNLARTDLDPGTRGAALRGLIWLTGDDAELRDVLIERVSRDSDANLRLAAQQTLAQRFSGDAEVGRLLATQAIHDEDATVRRAALRELADHFANEETAEILKRLAIDDPAAGVRFTAADALAEYYGADTSIRAVIMAQAAADRDTIVRLAAVRILITLGGDNTVHDRLLERVQTDPDPQVIREAATALLALPSYQSAVFSSLRERAERDGYGGVRRAAIDLLVAENDPDPALELLLFDHARNEPDPTVFRAAAAGLMDRPGSANDLKALLLERISSVHWQIRLPAAELLGLGSSADADIRERLMDCARSDADIQVRRAAARVLGTEFSDYPEVKALLRGLIDDPDWSLRCGALQALGATYGDDTEIRALFVELAHYAPDLEFRQFAGQALTWLPEADPDQLPDVAGVGLQKLGISSRGAVAARDDNLVLEKSAQEHLEAQNRGLRRIESTRPVEHDSSRVWLGSRLPLYVGIPATVSFSMGYPFDGDMIRSAHAQDTSYVTVLLMADFAEVAPVGRVVYLNGVRIEPLTFTIIPGRVGEIVLRFLVYTNSGILAQELHAVAEVAESTPLVVVQ